ncbi:MAG: DUF4199 domain-containing protein [Bacteroidota bacterium]|nr:DUF4199 domain-containing protein [Bacteroidota bacterium]
MKKSSDILSKALLISLILIVVDLIGGFAHLKFTSWFKWISTIVIISSLIIICISYGKQHDEVTFGKVFGYSFKISLVISLFMLVYTYISIYVIFPEFIDQALQNAREGMEAKGGLTEEQIDAGMAITKKFMQPVPLGIFSFLVTLFVSTIGSLLGAAFTKKSEPNVFQNNP